MSTTKKVWLGISTFAPFLAFILMAISYFVIIASAANEPVEPPIGPMVGSVLGIMLSYLILFAAMIINVIVYVGQIIRNPKLDNGGKTLWICLMFFFNFIVMIVYYFLYIVGDRPPVQEPPATALPQ